MGSFSLWHWFLVLGVVVMIFGTKKLSSAGTDLGSALKNFKAALREGASAAPDLQPEPVRIAEATKNEGPRG